MHVPKALPLDQGGMVGELIGNSNERVNEIVMIRMNEESWYRYDSMVIYTDIDK